MDRRHAAAALALLVLLAGCTQYYRNIRHPKYANPEFHQDLSECTQKSTYPLSTLSGSPGDSSVEIDQTLIQLCMVERGWRRAN
jgi:hypothetical protein